MNKPVRRERDSAVVMPQDDRALVERLGTAEDPLTDDALTGRFRVFQRERGHRYSLDDVLTAEVAARARPGARTHADLGCGLGSVLLMVADRLGDARHLGIEAQSVSFELATRNVARNDLGGRITLRHGDLRALVDDASLAHTFELVTGTPPYVKPGTSTPAPDPQKAYARVEYRGGVEDYLRAAAFLLTEDGTVVVCCDARAEARVDAGATTAGLAIHARLDAIPRAGSAALFSVYTLRRHGPDDPGPSRSAFVARDREGLRSEAYLDLREAFGLPRAYDPERTERP